MQKASPVTLEEYTEWREHSITKAFFKAIRNHREVMKEDLILGLYDNPEFAMGKASALQELQEMKYEQLMEILSEK